jgi:hypothetical protein
MHDRPEVGAIRTRTARYHYSAGIEAVSTEEINE